MWVWLFLINLRVTLGCIWPKVDALFVVDGTGNVGLYNYQLTKQFISAVIDQMNIGSQKTRVAYAAFNPKAVYEFNFNFGTNANAVYQKLQNLIYLPCLADGSETCSPQASVNSIASHELSIGAGDRQPIPDVIIIISSSLYRIPELLDKEVLIAPISPIHAFSITVGTLDDFPTNSIKFTSSATTIKFSAYNYSVLERLKEPLCNAANDFIKSNQQTGIVVFLSSTAGIITLICIALLIIICLLLFICALCRYRKENAQLRQQNEIMENEYQRALAVNRSLQQTLDHTYANMGTHTTIVDSNAIPRNFDRQNGQTGIGVNSGNHGQLPVSNVQTSHPGMTDSEYAAYSNVKKYDRRKNAVVPLITPENNDTNKKKKETNSVLTDTDVTEANDEETEENDSENDENEADDGENDDDDGEVDEDSDDGEISEPNSVTRPRKGHLSTDHPALTLPPVDIMILIDCSSSIGNSQFEQMKEQVCVFLSNVDIAPGRSRVAVVVFASEPSVYFGYDKYYSYRSIRAKIKKTPYIGGPTFLAKALLFASGILYQEQNMKDGRHRKHKFMPTPHHDRLQVLVVVSDGYSEDNFEKVSYILSEKLHVKTAAMVMRTYNKEKLLPITRFDGAIFLIEQTEALSMWLWRQQRIWNENYGGYIQKEKALMAEAAPKKRRN